MPTVVECDSLKRAAGTLCSLPLRPAGARGVGLLGLGVVPPHLPCFIFSHCSISAATVVKKGEKGPLNTTKDVDKKTTTIDLTSSTPLRTIKIMIMELVALFGVGPPLLSFTMHSHHKFGISPYSNKILKMILLLDTVNFPVTVMTIFLSECRSTGFGYFWIG